MSIQLKNVSKAYNQEFSLKNINLEIETGELFVLLGASGSGKSTILRLIAGLLPVDEGRIFLNNIDVTDLSPQQRNTGFVFQNYSLFGHLTVAQNIGFGLAIRHLPKAQRLQRINELLKLIELDGYGDRMPWQISGGQQQRVALARALAPNPRVLLLDEPFGALDVKIRGQLRQNLRALQQQFNITTILVTHDQEEAFELADRIGVIENGQIIETGTPDSLYRRPQTRYTANFIGQVNLIAAQRNGNHLQLGDGASIPVTEDGAGATQQAVDLLFRPEEVELAPQGDTLRDSHRIGQGVVQEIIFTGHYLRVTVGITEGAATGKTIQAVLLPAQLRQTGILPGSVVQVGMKDFHIMPEQNR